MRTIAIIFLVAAAVKLASAKPAEKPAYVVNVTPAAAAGFCPCHCNCVDGGKCNCVPGTCQCYNCPGIIAEQPKPVKMVQVCNGGVCRLVPESQLQTTYISTESQWTSQPQSRPRLLGRIFGGGRRSGG